MCSAVSGFELRLPKDTAQYSERPDIGRLAQEHHE